MPDDSKKQPAPRQPLFSFQTPLSRTLDAARQAAAGQQPQAPPPDDRSFLERLEDWWDPDGAPARAQQRKLQPNRYRVPDQR